MSVGQPPSGSSRVHAKLRLVVCAVLAAILAWQALALVAAAGSRNLMFDGAMNLEISRSIVDGNGPRRMYDSAEMFPPGVQTKEPFVLLGAAVFKIFGIGHWQAQLPNLIYFLLLTALIVVVVGRASDPTTALTAGVLALAAPALTQYALNGYGEIPTLFFGLSSLAVLVWPERLSTRLVQRCMFAGVLAGLALATKVIGIVQIAAVGLVLCLRVLSESERPVKPLVRAVLAFAAGLVLPLLLIEGWRWFWLGKEGYLAWWDFQFTSIMSQSGATPRAPQGGVSEKISRHLGILASELQRSRGATIALILVPLAATAFSYSQLAPEKRKASKWLLLGLVLMVSLYFPWWLAVVPTEKAWLRYIYIGLMSLALLAAISATSNIVGAVRARDAGRRALHVVLALAVCIVYWPFVVKSVGKEMTFSASEDVQATEYAAGLISRLGPDRMVFGYGWYAAPTIQLYVERGFTDLTDWPIGRVTDKTAYLVADRATLVTGVLQRVLARYPNRRMMRSNEFAQVYEVNFANPFDPFAGMDTASARSQVDFSEGDYALTSGIGPFEPMGGRFTESDSEILLKYEGQSVLDFTGYMALPRYYRRPEPLSGRVIVNGCPPMPFAFENTGWQEFKLLLTCRPAAGNVRVRLLFDNVFDLPLVYDHQRALLLRSIGFSGNP